METEKQTQTETEKVGGSYSKEKNKTNKEIKLKKKNFFFSSEFTMHLFCDQTLVMWREKLNKFLMIPRTSAALKICCT